MITRTDAHYEIGKISAYTNGKIDHAQKSQHGESVSFKKILEDTFERSNIATQTSATYTRAQAGGDIHRAQTEVEHSTAHANSAEKTMSTTSASLSSVAWRSIFDDEKEEDDDIAKLNEERVVLGEEKNNSESEEEEEVIDDGDAKLKKLYYISSSGDRMLLVTTEEGEVITRRNLGPAMSMNEATGLTDLTDAQILSDAENMTLSSLASGSMF